MRFLPDRVRRVLPGDTAWAWETLAQHLPPQFDLGGGTAVAAHLGHRKSRDLSSVGDRPAFSRRSRPSCTIAHLHAGGQACVPVIL